MTQRPSPSVGDAIALRIRKYRLQRDWSVRRLAEECAKRGAPQLTVASLGNIERGVDPDAKRKRREVSVEELLVLAYVLDVPPLTLMLPLNESNTVELFPGTVVETGVAAVWLDGSVMTPDALGLLGRPLPGVNWATYESAIAPLQHLQAIDRARRWAEWERAFTKGEEAQILSTRRRLDARWEANPENHAVMEATARVNHRPQPGSSMSDAEWIAQWRVGAQQQYELRLRQYAEAIWRAADAGVALPAIPRLLYDEIMRLEPETAASHEEWNRAENATPTDPEWSRTVIRPFLPQAITILEGTDDGR